jgi:hypothetical protein
MADTYEAPRIEARTEIPATIIGEPIASPVFSAAFRAI